MDKVKNAKRNIYTGIIYKIVSLFMPFVLRTVIIKQLGTQFLGLDSLFTSILQVLNLSELGISTAVIYSMYKPIAENNYKEINAIYGFLKKAYKIIGIVVFLVGIIILPFLKYFIKGNVPVGLNIYILYFIYLVNLAVSYLLYSYKNAILNAYQRVDVSNIISTISRVILYIIQLIVLISFRNFYIYVLILLFSTVLNNILTSMYVDKFFPCIKPCGLLSPIKKSEIKKQVIGIFIGKICIVSRNSFDSIVISSLIGLSATAIYNNYYYIISALISVMAIITNAITAGIGNSVALYNQKKNYSDFKKFNFLYLWIGNWFTCCLLCLYQPFMMLWVGEKYLLPNSTIILFTLYFFVLLMGDIKATYVVATGLWWENKFRAIIESVLNLVLNILLGKIWGINGILIATIVTIVCINYIGSCEILFKHYFSEEKILNFMISSFRYFVATVISSFVCYTIIDNVGFKKLFNIVICVIVLLIIPNIIYFVSLYDLEERRLALNWLKLLIINKR